MPKGRALEPVLFVPDTHAPYHDERAWQLMLEVGRALRPKTIVHLGDLADFYRVSRFSKDPARQHSFEDEIHSCRGLLNDLGTLGAKRKVFVEGNHEDRLRAYLWDKAPELFGFVGVPTLFGLKERGWEHVPYKQHARLGALYLTHDVGYSGKYAARRLLETYQHSVVAAHTHRLDLCVEGDATGSEHRVAASLGWLGDVSKVDYMHQAKALKEWSLAFGVGAHDPDTGYVSVVPVPIVNYSCVVNGRLYVG